MHSAGAQACGAAAHAQAGVPQRSVAAISEVIAHITDAAGLGAVLCGSARPRRTDVAGCRSVRINLVELNPRGWPAAAGAGGRSDGASAACERVG
jgi:hypothetical protein